jgi:hypothetical protein
VGINIETSRADGGFNDEEVDILGDQDQVED